MVQNFDPNLKIISESSPYYPVHLASPNSTFSRDQSVRSVVMRRSSVCVEKQNSFFRNYEHFKNILSRRTIKVKTSCPRLSVDVSDNKEKIYHKNTSFYRTNLEKKSTDLKIAYIELQKRSELPKKTGISTIPGTLFIKYF